MGGDGSENARARVGTDIKYAGTGADGCISVPLQTSIMDYTAIRHVRMYIVFQLVSWLDMLNR